MRVFKACSRCQQCCPRLALNLLLDHSHSKVALLAIWQLQVQHLQHVRNYMQMSVPLHVCTLHSFSENCCHAEQVLIKYSPVSRPQNITARMLVKSSDAFLPSLAVRLTCWQKLRDSQLRKLNCFSTRYYDSAYPVLLGFPFYRQTYSASAISHPEISVVNAQRAMQRPCLLWTEHPKFQCCMPASKSC